MENQNQMEKTDLQLTPFASIQSFEAVQRVCGMLSMSDLVPKMYQAGADPASKAKATANCLIAYEMANRIGASPMMVMQNMYIVHGQPAWSSKFLIATINASSRFTPLRYEFKGTEGADDFGCRCFAYDRSDVKKEEKLHGSWVDITMAKKEGWFTKSGSKWQTMPQLMLQYRAAAFWARTYAPELSMGIKTDDEVADIVDVEYEEVKPKAAPKKFEDLPDTTKAELAEKLALCNNADEVDMLSETLDDALCENHFVKKMFAARKAAINAGVQASREPNGDEKTVQNTPL
jgi:hypothetical protein